MNLRRKRLRLMRDTQWRGYARTAEGNPITLSQVRSVAAISVLGNSSQSGVPSPDNPVDVIGTGERTGNLFDISQVGDTNTLYNDGEKLKVTAYSNSTKLSVEKFLAMTGLRPGDVFTVARQYEVINGIANSATGSICFNKKDGSGQFIIIPGNKDVAINVVPDDFNSDIYSDINFYGANSGDLKEVIFSNIQILKGSYTAENMPQYEPYGYKVAVTASGRNLFDVSLLENKSSGYVEDNNIYVAGYPYTTKISPEKFLEITGMQEGDTFTAACNVSYETDMDNTKCVMFIARGSNTNSLLIANTSQGMNIKTSIIPENFNSDNYTSLYVYCGTLPNLSVGDLRGVINQFMILKGSYTASTMPPYEPYKEPQSFNVYTSEQLHGVGAAHDTVILDFDKHKAELAKYAGYCDLNNIEKLNSGSIDGGLYRYYIITNPSMKVGAGLAGFCNILPESPLWVGNTTENVHFGQQNSAIYFMVNNQYDNKDDFISYLSNNGQTTPYVIYQLATPTATDITSLQDWDALPQLRGTWILTASGGTEPTLRAEYYSEERSTE